MRISLMTAMMLVALFFMGRTASAEPPRVVTDIAAVDSLVAQVMAGLGSPELLMDHGASPHAYRLRPSQAQALERADVVVFVSSGLTPWLGEAAKSLAPGARRIELMELEGVERRETREAAVFGPEPAEPAEEEPGHDGDDREAGADDHGGLDPHGWLLPENAVIWLLAIAEALAEADPENAETYRSNATAAQMRIRETMAQVSQDLAPYAAARFVVFHDAYQYFEEATGLRAEGAIALSDASAPGAARVAAIRDAVQGGGISCVFAEPQFNLDLARTVIEGSGARLGVLDPMGSGIEPGEGFYGAFLRYMGTTMAECFDGG